MKHLLTTSFLIVGLLLTNLSFANQIWGGRFVIEADEFIEMKDDSILVIDARTTKKFKKKHPKGAVSLQWTDFSKTKKSERGDLLPLATVAEKLGKIGVSSDQPIIVVDDADKGWGESGRIAWMLKELGHDDVAIINGGVQALEKAGFPMEKTTSTKAAQSFKLKKAKTWSYTLDEVKAAPANQIAVIDTRERREYKGWTPYGESRGGHVRGAKHLYYRDFLDKTGRLKKKETIVALLSERGIKKDTKIAAYCTGGIRSAWMVVVLRHFGYEAFNYAGSMWQWSSRDKDDYPLVKNLNPFSD